MSAHFLQQYKTWLRDGWTWSMLCGVREMRSQTDYIMVKNKRLIQDGSVRDARHNTDHYLVLCCHRGSAPSKKSLYLRKRKSLLLKPLKTPGRFDRLFVDLQGDRRGSHRRPGDLSAIELQHIRVGTASTGAYEHSSEKSRRVYRRTANSGQPIRDTHSSPSSLPTHL